jgi:HSP20 family protein
MRSRFPSPTYPAEIAEFADEIRRLFDDLGQAPWRQPLTGECAPTLDVYETDDSIHIVVDLPGVETGAIRVVARGDSVLLVGEKIARRARADSSFHLVERDFGRFARVVRLTRACDTSRARAHLADGELHVWVPKIAERRGRTLHIAIT